MLTIQNARTRKTCVRNPSCSTSELSYFLWYDRPGTTQAICMKTLYIFLGLSGKSTTNNWTTPSRQNAVRAPCKSFYPCGNQSEEWPHLKSQVHLANLHHFKISVTLLKDPWVRLSPIAERPLACTTCACRTTFLHIDSHYNIRAEEYTEFVNVQCEKCPLPQQKATPQCCSHIPPSRSLYRRFCN